MKRQQRTLENVREHYEIEKQLAQRLRNSTRQERQTLYTSLYDELFIKIPHHPQISKKSSPQESAKKVYNQMLRLQPFLRRNSTFLEVGSGDCALSFEVSKLAKVVYAVDVSKEITKDLTPPPNFNLVLSDGSSIPVPANSVDVAYSNQLMEHLHPDDAFEQLQNIYRALAPGGVYICITPNRLNGPHDVSRFFDPIATGFHLKEYTVTELHHLFIKVGFSEVKVYINIRRVRIFLPVFPVKFFEKILGALPFYFRKSIASIRPIKLFLGIKLVGIK